MATPLLHALPSAAAAALDGEPTSLDLAAYLDRLDRHRERLVDDIRAARVRAAWATHERRARQALCTADARALEDVGILHEPHASCADHDLIHRRRQQIGALDRLRALTEHARQTAPDTR